MALKQLTVYYSDDYPELRYESATIGQIALHRVTDSFTVLKIYFPNLTLVNQPATIEAVDETVEVMLTNYPVTVQKLTDLDGKTIAIDKDWNRKNTFTMIQLFDGEPIQQNSIRFTLKDETTLEVCWTGIWGEERNDTHTMKLCLDAKVVSEIETPLCMKVSDLLERNGEKAVAAVEKKKKKKKKKDKKKKKKKDSEKE
ncbi:hypothetical protein NBRC110019_20440 [Neptunitalea chrysea]|uniref:Uncharacterized protein n=1 Tax=Neptunitalea chrysea TaxID=1647581 RepID=A0A9W6B5J6_9FLAO|nr:hypothetical protein [Neptunitalea chrysea]GLB53004.1 hypothetical protein NBRC110019_20440 [Neptunitalea chrysea]